MLLVLLSGVADVQPCICTGVNPTAFSGSGYEWESNNTGKISGQYYEYAYNICMVNSMHVHIRR